MENNIETTGNKETIKEIAIKLFSEIGMMQLVFSRFVKKRKLQSLHYIIIKEILYSRIFHNTVVATASMVIRNKLEFNDKLVYHIIHSIVYGLAN